MPVMWLPRPIYEAIPYASMAMGAALAGAAFFVERAPHGLLLAAGGLAITVGVMLWMRRRAYRASLREYAGRPLDD
jgi:hypothetical protein